jgi:hypothetical protein
MSEVKDPGEIQHQQIITAMRGLRTSVDSRLLLTALVANAAVLAADLIAAEVVKQDEITNLFAMACADAITPDPKRGAPPVVQMHDGDPAGTKR